MKSKIFLRLIILCLIGLFSFKAAAEPISDAEAGTWVNEKGQLLLKTFSEPDIRKKYEALDDLFLNYVDLDYIGKFVMGKYWRQMTQEQREMYLPLFKRYSLGIYKSFPLDFALNINFSITGVKIESGYANVVTAIDLDPAAPQEQKKIFIVEFRLNKNNGKIKIIDLKLAESSLILSYRSRFYEMIKNNDDELSWFLEDLEMTTISTERTNQMRLEGKIR